MGNVSMPAASEFSDAMGAGLSKCVVCVHVWCLSVARSVIFVIPISRYLHNPPPPVTLKIVSASGYPRYSGPRAEGSKIVIIYRCRLSTLAFLVHLLAITHHLRYPGDQNCLHLELPRPTINLYLRPDTLNVQPWASAIISSHNRLHSVSFIWPEFDLVWG